MRFPRLVQFETEVIEHDHAFLHLDRGGLRIPVDEIVVFFLDGVTMERIDGKISL